MFGLITGAIGAVTGIVKGVKSIAKAVKKSKPVVKVAASTAASMGLVKVASSSPVSMPSYSGGSSGGLPALQLAAPQTKAIQQSSPGGLAVPWWKGPGGKLQAPWSDPRIPEYLKQFALDDAYLQTYYRAPRGYVVVRDASGRPFAVNKAIARSFGIWRPKKKPPISVSDWQAYKKAERVEKKLKRIAGPALRRRGYRTVAASASARASVKTRRR
jgi:hypothetical protein